MIWSLTGTTVTLSVLSCPPRALLHGRGPLGQVHQAISTCTENQLLAAVFVESDSACVKSIVTQCYPVPDSTHEINYHTLGHVEHFNGAFFCIIVCVEGPGRIIIKRLEMDFPWAQREERLALREMISEGRRGRHRVPGAQGLEGSDRKKHAG